MKFLGYPWRLALQAVCPPSRLARSDARLGGGSDIVRFDVISRRFRAASCCFALACCVELASARSQGQRPLLVSFAPVDAAPGRCRACRCRRRNGDEQITGDACSDRISRSTTTSTSAAWRALVGIDLDTKPGAYQLAHRAQRRRGGGRIERCASRRSNFACAGFECAWRLRRSAAGGARADRARQRRARRGVRARLAEASGRAPSCCPSTGSRRATSARAATTTASGARRMRASISSASPARRSARRTTATSSSPRRCTSPATRSWSTTAIGCSRSSRTCPSCTRRPATRSSRRRSSGWSARPGGSPDRTFTGAFGLNGARVDPLSLVAATSGEP